MKFLWDEKWYLYLNKIDENYKKTTRYLVALGCVEYFSIVLGFIPSIIYGYNAAMAQYQEVEYSSWLSVYMVYIPIITLGLIVIALLWATYESFIKKNKVKNFVLLILSSFVRPYIYNII